MKYYQIKYLLLYVLLVFNSTYAQKYGNKVVLDNKDSWSLVIVPDVQNYSKYYQNQPILDLINQWIVANRDSLNIKMTLCTGDLVEQDDVILTGNNGNVSSKEQWEFVRKSFGILDHKVPYILASGNHDYTIDQQGNRSSNYDNYFRVDQNTLNKDHLVQYGFDHDQSPSLTNSLYEFKGLNSQDWLILNLEYAPSDAALNWANEVLQLDQYKQHKVILLTHAFLNRDNERLKGQNKWIIFKPIIKQSKQLKSNRILLPNSNNGQQIWEKLVAKNKNIDLVISGHISGVGYRKDLNEFQRTVHQMLFDMQSESFGHYGNGGDGLIRIIEFYPDGKSVKVKTFSVLFALSEKTAELAYKKDALNEFIFTLD
ncbi:metallophosphoesterase [Myroides pelagicus]|uniref:metallophosphoesterase n=1 Tax=Myroides pelagicus TaxID=270914 RepID=UPI002DB978BC|nr:metallophosphoesterase [Myroides pelagicus]MEC4115234.1 metallophosphoesterase [Myroides pelagicus]